MPDLNRAYTWAINTCNADNVGYSQTYRNQRTVNSVTYYDCSSFINYALLSGGWETPNYAPSHNPFTTAIEGNVLKGLGFTEHTVTSTFEWQPGDIAWRTNHTEMCYRGGVNGVAIFMGAHTPNATLANQVSIGSSGGNANYANTSFTKCYRYGDTPAEDDNSGTSGNHGTPTNPTRKGEGKMPIWMMVRYF